MDVTLCSVTATVLAVLYTILCSCITSTASSTSSSQAYKMVKSPTGKTMCATDRPTASETLRHSTASWTRCAAACSSSPCCLLFQFRTNSSTCELFGFMPVGFVTATNCTAYAVFPDRCPAGFQAVNCVNCFRLLGISTKLTWQQATDTCRAFSPQRSNLVMIADSKKQAIVESFLRSNADTSCVFFWTSGQRISVTGPPTDFVWKPVDGVAIALTYQHWDPNNPDFAVNCEYCLGLDGATSSYPFMWNDGYGENRFCALCEFTV